MIRPCLVISTAAGHSTVRKRRKSPKVTQHWRQNKFSELIKRGLNQLATRKSNGQATTKLSTKSSCLSFEWRFLQAELISRYRETKIERQNFSLPTTNGYASGEQKGACGGFFVPPLSTHLISAMEKELWGINRSSDNNARVKFIERNNWCAKRCLRKGSSLLIIGPQQSEADQMNGVLSKSLTK
jgi:hypothetical protein